MNKLEWYFVDLFTDNNATSSTNTGAPASAGALFSKIKQMVMLFRCNYVADFTQILFQSDILVSRRGA